MLTEPDKKNPDKIAWKPIISLSIDCNVLFSSPIPLFQTSMSAIAILVHQTLIVQTSLVLLNVNVKMDSQEMVSLVMV